MSFLTSLAAFIVAIGILVTVHEFGHYWVARRVGVKVERFSIGFGRPLLTRRWGQDQTEFVVAAVPLGGYVKMLDEREAPVAPDEQHRAFNRKPLWARNAVVVAGPAANFLFAIVAYAVMFMIGVPGMKPLVGEVTPGSAAALAGLQSGEEILQVGSRRVQDWDQANLRLLDYAVRTDAVVLTVRDAQGMVVERRLPLDNRRELLAEGQFLERLGLQPYRPVLAPILGRVERGSPADQAGLQAGDRVLSADGVTVSSWSAWVEVIQAAPETPMRLRIEREGGVVERVITPEARRLEDGTQIGRIGAAVETQQPQLQALATLIRLGPWEALHSGAARTWEVSVLTLRVLWRMLTGEASVKNIAGPVTIAEFAGATALLGITAFLGFMALISVSLGIINLLPIPLLDGGHLLYNTAEWVKGSPVSERTQIIGQQFGLVMIAGLMMLALYNDFSRLFG